MTMTDTHDDWLRRVRALLETAESYADAGNQDAADAYTAKAQQLMEKHGLDAALVESRQGTSEEVITRTLVAQGRFFLRWSTMLHLIGKVHDVRTVHSKTRRDPATDRRGDRYVATRIEMFGFERDVENVEMLWTSLMVQATSALARETIPRGVNRWTFQINFLDAFNNRVYGRLHTERARAIKDVEKTEGGDLLPVLRDRKARVDEFVDRRYVSLGKGRSIGARTSSAGYDAGVRAANGANLGGSQLPTSRKAIGR